MSEALSTTTLTTAIVIVIFAGCETPLRWAQMVSAGTAQYVVERPRISATQDQRR